MKKKLNGGLEGIIATVIIAGIVVALIFAVVMPMSKSGDQLLDTTTNALADQQKTIGPK